MLKHPPNRSTRLLFMIQQSRTRSTLLCLLATACLVALHVAAMAAVARYLTLECIDDVGLKPGGHIGFGHPADWDYLKVAIQLTLPLIVIEAAATLWRRVWLLPLGVIATLAAAAVHGWVTALVVGLRLWDDTAPVSRSDISDAIATGTFLAVLHAGALVATILVLSALRRLVRDLRSRRAADRQLTTSA